VFINPALVEPFGLTLIEAAAHGLPVVATANGGPVGIHQVYRFYVHSLGESAVYIVCISACLIEGFLITMSCSLILCSWW
jgi:hypothetical protein